MESEVSKRWCKKSKNRRWEKEMWGEASPDDHRNKRKFFCYVRCFTIWMSNTSLLEINGKRVSVSRGNSEWWSKNFGKVKRKREKWNAGGRWGEKESRIWEDRDIVSHSSSWNEKKRGGGRAVEEEKYVVMQYISFSFSFSLPVFHRISFSQADGWRWWNVVPLERERDEKKKRTGISRTEEEEK